MAVNKTTDNVYIKIEESKLNKFEIVVDKELYTNNIIYILRGRNKIGQAEEIKIYIDRSAAMHDMELLKIKQSEALDKRRFGTDRAGDYSVDIRDKSIARALERYKIEEIGIPLFYNLTEEEIKEFENILKESDIGIKK